MAPSFSGVSILQNAPRAGQSMLFVPLSSERASRSAPVWKLFAEGDHGVASLAYDDDEDRQFALPIQSKWVPLEVRVLLESWIAYQQALSPSQVDRLGTRGPESFPLRPLTKKERGDAVIRLNFDHPALTRLPLVDYVTVRGWGSASKRSRYTLEQLQETLQRALVTARTQWGWWPEYLSIAFFSDPGKMGLARVPRRSDEEKPILLNTTLLERYTLEAIYRVLLHELCHQLRFEQDEYVVNQKLFHDERFCALLAKVDPRVRPDESCSHFHDDVDRLSSAEISGGRRPTLFARRFSGERLMRFAIGDPSSRSEASKAKMTTDLGRILGYLVRDYPQGEWRSIPYRCLSESRYFSGPTTAGELVDNLLAHPDIQDDYKKIILETIV